MQSNVKKHLSTSATKILYIPILPPSLSDWSILKKHFSQFGNVNVVLNPQQRNCMVSFKSLYDAKRAKTEGCCWKNVPFKVYYWTDEKVKSHLDPRATNKEAVGYDELDKYCSDDDDMEHFGISSVSSKQSSTDRETLKTLVSKVVLPKDIISRKLKKQMLIKKVRETGKEAKPMKRAAILSEKSTDVRSRHLEKLKLKAQLTDSVIKRKEDIKNRVVSDQKRVETVIRKRLVGRIKDEGKGKVASASNKQTDLSLKEKFTILEDRDKLIRKKFVKRSNIKEALIGTCPDMCPEKERIMREYRHLVSVYELIPGSQIMDPALAVKEYSRSSADQDEPLPHELRPEPVLSMTMAYLILNIMPLITDPNVSISEWYDFCWDRLRSIRKDIIQQQLCSLETVTIIEQCARFHILCYDRLWGADPSIFDEKINSENLMNCLQTLRHMYEDLGKEGIKCPNEPEFNAYMILINMKTSDLMSEYQQFSTQLQQRKAIRSAVELYLALNNGMYAQFFKLVKNTTYLNACLLQRYFYHIRVQALKMISRAYCPSKKGGTVPLKNMMRILKLDSPEDTVVFCENHGFILKENQKDFRFYKDELFFPETKVRIKKSSSLITSKRLPIIETLVSENQVLRVYKNHKVHNSFTSDGRLRDQAFDASDQKIKLPSKESLSGKRKTEEHKEKMDEDDDEYDDIGVQNQVVGVKSEKEKKELDNMEEVSEESTLEEYFMEIDVDVDSNKKFSNVLPSVQQGEERSVSKGSADTGVESGKQVESPFRFDLREHLNTSNQQTQNDFKFQEHITPDPFKRSLPFSDQTSEVPPFTFKLNFTSTTPDNREFQHYFGSPKRTTETFSKELVVAHTDMLNEEYDCSKNETVNKSLKSENDGTIHNSNFNASSDLLWNRTDKKKQDWLPKVMKKDFENEILKRPFSGSLPSYHKSLSTSNIGSLKNRKFDDTSEELNMTSHLIQEKVDDEVKMVFYEKEEEQVKECREKVGKLEKQRKLESERIMQLLRKDLRRRLKVTAARQCFRRWKQIVEQLKLNRKNFPLVMSVPAEQHVELWGTVFINKSFSTVTLINRLNEKQHNMNTVSKILDNDLHNLVPYVGKDLVQSVASNINTRLTLKDFHLPLYFKLIVSIPIPKGNTEEKNFFINKFKTFFLKLFYKTDSSVLGCVTQEITSHNEPVHYCANVIAGNDTRKQDVNVTGMTGLLFVLIDGVESSSEKLKRLKNILSSDKNFTHIPVAVLRIGSETALDKVDSMFYSLKEKSKKNYIRKYKDFYWNDLNAVMNSLYFLTENLNLCSDIQVNTLLSLMERFIESIYNTLVIAKSLNGEFCEILQDPNRVIQFYNLVLTSLQEKIVNSNFKDYNVIPPEFKGLVQFVNRPNMTRKSSITFNKSRRPGIVKAFTRAFLPKLSKWPPNDENDLLHLLGLYCDEINCYHLLPRIIRVMDLKEDSDLCTYLSDVNWVDIVVGLLARNLINSNRESIEDVVVIYNESDIDNIFKTEFNFKLLHVMLNSID